MTVIPNLPRSPSTQASRACKKLNLTTVFLGNNTSAKC